MNLLKSTPAADLLTECYCGAVFEFEPCDIITGRVERQHYLSMTPQGRLFVECPCCRAQIEIGSYEIRISPHDVARIRAKLKPSTTDTTDTTGTDI